MRPFINIIAVCLLLASCSKNTSFISRKYQKGVYAEKRQSVKKTLATEGVESVNSTTGKKIHIANTPIEPTTQSDKKTAKQPFKETLTVLAKQPAYKHAKQIENGVQNFADKKIFKLKSPLEEGDKSAYYESEARKLLLLAILGAFLSVFLFFIPGVIVGVIVKNRSKELLAQMDADNAKEKFPQAYSKVKASKTIANIIIGTGAVIILLLVFLLSYVVIDEWYTLFSR